MWQRDSYRATHCNLQALREMDAACGISFLRTDHSRGDWRLLIGSPDHASLADAVEEEDVFGVEGLRGVMPPPPVMVRPPSAQERTSPSSCTTAATFL